MKNQNTQNLKLVFDLDNTLLFRDQAMLDCIEHLFNCQLSTSQKATIQKKDKQGHSDRIHFCQWLKAFLDLPVKTTTIWSLISQNIGQFVTINTTTNSVLSTLQAKYECILLTNGGIENQSKKIAQTGLNRFFPSSHIFISEALGTKKPELATFQLVENQFGTNARFCMIGDHWEKDILGAANAGWYGVHLTTKPRLTHSKKITSIASLLLLENALNKWRI